MSEPTPVSATVKSKNQKAGKKGKSDGRKNNGREKGYRAPQTLERMVAKRRLVERIVRATDRIFNSQLDKGLGEKFLMVKITERGPQGGVKRVYHEIVREPETIIAYLDGTLKGNKPLGDADHFYYMTTKEADNNALSNLLDRAYGRPTEKVELDPANEGDLSELTNEELDKKINDYIVSRTAKKSRD